MKKIETNKWYNSELDKILNSEKNEVFIKAKLVKRVTYGEYLFEPKNGFKLDVSSDGKTIILDLDKCDVYQLDQPQLNPNQQKYLKQLQYNHERLGNTHDALFFGLVDYEKRWSFNDENFAQVLKIFVDWTLEQEEG